jgi:hypothetical protein
LLYARLLKTSDLLPWEFDNYPADEWHLAVSVLGTFEDAKADAKAQLKPPPDAESDE